MDADDVQTPPRNEPAERRRDVPHDQRAVEGSDCCCCFKAQFQPWHGSQCPHGFGGRS
jgi:hypothetical protein